MARAAVVYSGRAPGLEPQNTQTLFIGGVSPLTHAHRVRILGGRTAPKFPRSRVKVSVRRPRPPFPRSPIVIISTRFLALTLAAGLACSQPAIEVVGGKGGPSGGDGGGSGNGTGGKSGGHGARGGFHLELRR